jgi:hypothetical protein
MRFHPSFITVCALLAGVADLFAQGSLTPPTAPAPTMKSLDQIRSTGIPLNQNNTPGDADYHFIISNHGSYFLTGDLAVTKTNGIKINAVGVTLDLNGFRVLRSTGTGGNGIEITATSDEARIHDGTIAGFASGIQSTAPSRACAVRDVAVTNCSSAGIDLAGEGALIESCRAHDNQNGIYAIHAGIGAVITHCVATNNTSVYGIFAEDYAVISDCTATNNMLGNFGPGPTAIHAGNGSTVLNCAASHNNATYGIQVGFGSSLSHSVAYVNTSPRAASAGIGADEDSNVSDCTSRGNTSTVGSPTFTAGMGFSIDSAGVIQNCVAVGNSGDGINLAGNGTALNNNCEVNGNANTGGAGIHVTFTAERVEGNNLASNHIGLKVDVAGNLIIRNSARGNSPNWQVVAGNAIFVVAAPAAGAINGNSGGTAPAANASANLTLP